ncbi:hypothetical protein EDD70_2333 [Hydrogenoanaerobacterium saccharovorans]|uniref:Ig-like domain (Group 3) n=1 Tax=Hydrogenoanaerobacterium saccharovorans TaxID=474960 RepID=A0A1H8CX67_9FIRM|nr:hypothetical protein [Hydrogenoanaerobacterium saccharovorans]RPF43369.1 hypothetical protein EDD70_2333 [Hydrogenoanaerobacterium saccharovorans]SEM99703.1 hypothetical protein SAMN05216180_2391 [Hydrogenoanaerobacterium saccharovorans]
MIRIPNRVIALVLAVTMLLSATSLTTFADDSHYNDSGYSDSGTYMEEPQDFSDEYAEYLIQLDEKNKEDGIQSTLWLDYMIKYGKALPYEQTPHSYVYKEPQIQPYQGLRRMRRSLQSNTVTTLGQLPLGAKVVDAATQWGDEPMIWIKSSDHVRVSYGKDLNTTHYGLTHQMDVNDEWGYTSAKGASYYVSEKIIGQFPKSIGYNETYFSNMLLKWLNEPNQNHFLGKNFYTDVLSEDLRRNMQVATFYGNYVYHKTYNNGRKIGKNVIMDAWVGQKGVEFIRAFQGKLENDTQYSYDAGIEDSDLMHKYHPIIGETKPFRPYKGVWGGVDENKNLLPSELVWGGTDGDGRDDDGSDGYYACDSLQNAIGGGSLLLCSGRIAANVRPVIALKDNTKVYAVPDGNGIYTLVPSLEKPVISQTYNSSNNKVIVTATSPEAQSMQILENGVEISYIRGNFIEYEISKNGKYSAKAIANITKETEFDVNEIDELGPQITYTPLTTGWARSKSTTITLTDAKTPSGMQYQINGGAWTNYTAPFSYDFTSNGSITVNARDKWGNPSSTTTITANQVDTTPPTPPVITKSPPNLWCKDDVVVSIDGGSDTDSGVKGYLYSIDSGNWQNYIIPFKITLARSTVIHARTIDNVGYVSQLINRVVNIERVKPTGVITYNKAWTNGNVELTFNASDLGGSGVQHVRPAGGSWTDGNTVKHSVSTNGTHSFEVEDNAGNAERISEEINNIDKVLPVIEEINFVKENDDLIQSILHFFNKQVSVHIKASDDASGVDKIEYQLIEKGSTIKEDGWLLYNPDELPKVSRRFSGTVAARCTDVATNMSLVKEEPVTVEDTPPTATHTLSTTDWTDGTVTIRLKAQDDLSGVANITLPDGTVVDGNTAEFTVSQNGTYRFIVVDKCGNILNYDVEVKKIDLTPCTATHTLSPNGYTNGRVEITVIAEDLESGVKSITLPDGTVVDGNTASYTVDANSTYTFQLTNNAGTTSDYVVTVDKIDKANPTITKFELRETQDSPVKQFFRSILPNTNMFRKQVELIVEAEDDHSGVNKIEYQAVPKGSQVLDSGWKTYHGGDKPSRLKKDMDATVYVRSLDNATNISAIVSKDAIIDGTAPTATYTLSTTDWVKDGIDITIKAKDNIVGVASITLPDGTVVDGDTATYHVTRNGVYTFILTDKLGTSCKYTVTINNIEEQLPTPPKTEPQPTDPNQPDELELEWSKAPEELDVKAEAPSGILKYQYRITKVSNPIPTPPDEKLPNKAKVLGTFVTDWLECNGKITVTDEGIFDVNVRSVSFAGNVSPESKYTVKNDFTPPTVTYNTTRNSIELKAEDNLSGVAKIVCEHGEVLGSEVSCPMKRTEEHVYTVTDDAGNPTVVTVKFKRRSNPSKPDYEPPLETGDTTAKPDKPHPHEPTPSEQQTTTDNSTPAEAPEVDTVNSLPNVPEQTKPNDTASTEPKEKTDSAYQIIVQLISDFVRNPVKALQNLWSWIMRLPMGWRVAVLSLRGLLIVLVAYAVSKKIHKKHSKKKSTSNN